jgi:hypothetical protein
VCHWIKVPRHALYGSNMPLPPLYNPGDRMRMESVTTVPEWMMLGYTWMLVIVDRLPKMLNYLPCHQDIDSLQLACMFFDNMICNNQISNIIVTDHWTQFTSQSWTRVDFHMTINCQLSTALHVLMDSQTEPQS